MLQRTLQTSYRPTDAARCRRHGVSRVDAWQPITAVELDALLAAQLADCMADQQQFFQRCSVVPHRVPIVRAGRAEAVFVVAKAGDFVLYYEDVEDGFNISALQPDGSVAAPGGEQWELCHALRHLAEAQSVNQADAASRRGLARAPGAEEAS